MRAAALVAVWLSAAPLAGAIPGCRSRAEKDGVPGATAGRSGLDYTLYESPQAAFENVLRPYPLVLAVGEAHAPAGGAVPSAAWRFSEELLPVLAGRASDLLVELMKPPKGCEQASRDARRSQDEVTARQAPYNQSEYLAMGERARGFGIVPDMLRPTCADLEDLRRSAEEGWGGWLGLIARLTAAQAARLIVRDQNSDADRGKMVVIYGGLLHNDLTPSADHAPFSYAPSLDARVQGRLVSLDLIVPEHIGDDEAWRALPWWPHYDRDPNGPMARHTVLFETGARAFTLVFPRASAAGQLRDR
jgi:hypothetical protein